MNSFIFKLLDFNICLGVPDHEIVWLSINITLSAILLTEAISCVIVIAVAPTIFTAVFIKSSIKLAVTGSNPDVGSSNNKIFGLNWRNKESF